MENEINTKKNCTFGEFVLLKEDSERNRWPTRKIGSINSGSKGNVRSVRILAGAPVK